MQPPITNAACNREASKYGVVSIFGEIRRAFEHENVNCTVFMRCKTSRVCMYRTNITGQLKQLNALL